MKRVKQILEEEIARREELRKQYDPFSEEYAGITDEIVNLHLKIYELDKQSEMDATDAKIKTIREKIEEETRRNENYRENVKIGLTALSIVLPIISYGIWFSIALKFEETGTFTSIGMKNIFGKMTPKINV